MINFNRLLARRGQATTEMVLLLPLFIMFILLVIRIFSILALKQKMEIASLYAARRWQLESHVDIAYAAWDKNVLYKNIKKEVQNFIGLSNPAARKFMDLSDVELGVEKQKQWWKVTVSVHVKPPPLGILCKYDKNTVCKDQRIRLKCFEGYKYICEGGRPMAMSKFVGLKPRPYKERLPSNKKGAKGNQKIGKSLKR